MSQYDLRYNEYKGLVEAELARRMAWGDKAPYQEVLDAMAYSLLSGGKRVRGVMTLAFYGLFDPAVERALPFAAAIEMVHAYSLIHDDLPCMDDDDLRRGKPSCHIAFGEATALLAGDGLLTLAFETATACENFPADRVLRAAGCLAAASGAHGMVGGQTMDLANEDKSLTAEQLDAINTRKTGALFRASALMGCHLGGGSEEQLQAAGDFAGAVGLAFQIVDDMLDVTADQAVLGKPVGSDKARHKNTYAAIEGMDRCKQRVAALNGEAIAALGVFGHTAFLAEMAGRLGGRDF